MNSVLRVKGGIRGGDLIILAVPRKPAAAVIRFGKGNKIGMPCPLGFSLPRENCGEASMTGTSVVADAGLKVKAIETERRRDLGGRPATCVGERNHVHAKSSRRPVSFERLCLESRVCPRKGTVCPESRGHLLPKTPPGLGPMLIESLQAAVVVDDVNRAAVIAFVNTHFGARSWSQRTLFNWLAQNPLNLSDGHSLLN